VPSTFWADPEQGPDIRNISNYTAHNPATTAQQNELFVFSLRSLVAILGTNHRKPVSLSGLAFTITFIRVLISSDLSDVYDYIYLYFTKSMVVIEQNR